MTEMISTFLPAAMMVLMLSLGLRLDPDEAPRAVLTGLAVQLIGLTIIALAVSRGLGLAPALNAGLMLVAASPGGVTSNYAALLARGSVGLSVAMTFVTSIAAPITLPLVLLAASVALPGAAGLWRISLAIVVVALVPILFGVIAARFAPHVSARMSRPACRGGSTPWHGSCSWPSSLRPLGRPGGRWARPSRTLAAR